MLNTTQIMCIPKRFEYPPTIAVNKHNVIWYRRKVNMKQSCTCCRRTPCGMVHTVAAIAPKKEKEQAVHCNGEFSFTNLRWTRTSNSPLLNDSVALYRVFHLSEHICSKKAIIQNWKMRESTQRQISACSDQVQGQEARVFWHYCTRIRLGSKMHVVLANSKKCSPPTEQGRIYI